MIDNSYKYYIIREKNLVIEILRGGFDLSGYLCLKKTQLEDPDYDPGFNLILDIRKVEDMISSEKIREYIDGVKPVQLSAKKIRVAVLTETPSQVTGAALYSMFEDKTLDLKIFSTLEYASNWLGIRMNDLKHIDFNS